MQIGPKADSRSKKRQKITTRNFVPMSEINVTPFVDIMLVLLIIFMVATTPFSKMLNMASKKNSFLDSRDLSSVSDILDKTKSESFISGKSFEPIPIRNLINDLPILDITFATPLWPPVPLLREIFKSANGIVKSSCTKITFWEGQLI